MTTYSLGDRVLVRHPKRGGEYEAIVIDDRGDSVRVVAAEDEKGSRREVVTKARIRPVPPPRVAPIIPPPGPGAELSVRHAAMTADLVDYAEACAAQIASLGLPRLQAVPKPPKPWRSEAYLDFVRGKACAAVTLPIGNVTQCSGDVVAHHHGPRGMGEKTDDSRTVPLCDGHHREFHDTGTLGGIERAALDAEFAVTMAWLLLQYITLDAFGRIAPSGYETVIKALTAALQEET